VAFGCEGVEDSRGSFHIHDFTFGTEGSIRLTNTQRITVA
jgi:hypothetical protein